ncbi:meprin A subunit beta-like [Menidia menidia]
MMKGYVFLLVNLAISSTFSANTNESDIVEIIEEKSITDANKGLLNDDIIETPNIQRSGIVDADQLWTSPVPYVFDSGLEMNAKGVILRAFEQFRLKTCIDFKPRGSEEYYISFEKKDGCFSYVGKVQPNGQVLSIGRFCDSTDTTEHEILHALGFYHEQSRFDRDNFVTIVLENVLQGRENNFRKVDSDQSTTNGVPYDYWSVMHYGKDFFTNGNGLTIITKDPKFQDVIGQRIEMSTSDVQELNLLYKCNSTIAFMMHCGFSNGAMCQMSRCSQSGNSWELVKQVSGGPNSDHTSLPSGNGDNGQEGGHFMHVSTASGQEGDSARLETQVMSPKRGCPVQCLQFYYYNSGNRSDVLNIWIREFQDEQDSSGTLRLMGQITGETTSHWKLQHVSLNATKRFQVVFEAQKGAGSSAGGLSVDDINLSETECPHMTLQIDDFEKLLNTSAYGTRIYSPRQYSKEGYAYRVATILFKTQFGLYFQLLSGDNDDQLEFPCLQRQMTSQMLDQNPNIQLHMTKQRSFTTDESQVTSSGISIWANPRETGSQVFTDENNQAVYGGLLFGRGNFLDMETVKSRDFLKGGSAIFTFNFQDLTPVSDGSVLPCPKLGPVTAKFPPTALNEGPCSPRISPTTTTPPTTTDGRISPTITTPRTTTEDSIFGFSPGMVASPLFTALLLLMLFTA